MFLLEYYLPAMLWNPIKIHQYATDPMATGWAQAFNKLNATMDDEMIYTLLSLLTTASKIATSGSQFTLAGASDPLAFIFNTAFTGALAGAAYKDVLRLEQLYRKQNFELDKTGAILITDPTAYLQIQNDPDTKSLLTRFINSDNDPNRLSISNTKIVSRSKVGIIDTATESSSVTGVKDPAGTIPSTSVSAMLGLLPSQVGRGLAQFDIFMIQDPSNYGYKMSADIRQGIVPLRKNLNGLAILSYGSPTV